MTTISHKTIELEIDSAPQRFYFDYTVCLNPECNCNGVIMQLSNQERLLDFFFDFSTESYKQKEYNEDETKIIDAFIDFIKSNKQDSFTIDFFKKRYTYVKDIMRNKRDVLRNFQLGSFLTYGEILWDEKNLKINIKNREYLILDAYCVTPRCSCKTVALNFFENIHKLGNRNPDFSFVYNYATHKPDELAGINSEEARKITDTFSDSLNTTFKQRHARLKNEVKQDILKKMEKKGFKQSDTVKRKQGRNDPCHCGSGIKYKKCCLQKDKERYGKPMTVEY